jgi:hypothetical protein
MPEIIDLGSLQLKFLRSKQDTGDSLDMFEMTLQPNARMRFRITTIGGMRPSTG